HGAGERMGRAAPPYLPAESPAGRGRGRGPYAARRLLVPFRRRAVHGFAPRAIAPQTRADPPAAPRPHRGRPSGDSNSPNPATPRRVSWPTIPTWTATM